MDTNNLILILLIGLTAGFLGGQIMRTQGQGIVGNMMVGVIGAIVGGVLFNMMGIAAAGLLGSIISATVGSVVLLAILGLFKQPSA